MKRLRIISVAVMAAFVCANLVACSKETTDVPAGKKRITKIVSEDIFNGITDESTITFKYDSEGRLIESSEKGTSYMSEWSSEIKYKWTDTAIVYTENYEYNNLPYTYEWTCTLLPNGKVGTLNDGYSNEDLTYNEDGRYDASGLWAWEGDKLMCTYSDYMSAYTYGETCKSGYAPLHTIYGSYLLLIHPELIGAQTNQLPISCTHTGYFNKEAQPYSSTYEYEFDSEGYVTKIVRTDTYDSYTHTFTDIITWE